MSSVLADHVVFSPIGDDRARAVARRLRQAIALGVLGEEEALPSESQLASRFGVATVTVRTALAELRAEGWIETRRGRGGGSFVRALGASAPGGEAAPGEQLGPHELRDLGDLHTALAGAAAALAAERADPDAARRLRQLAQAVAGAHGATAAARADSRFHIEVAAASRSARLTSAEMSVQAELGSLLWRPGAAALTAGQAADEHVTLAEAVRLRRPRRAREIAERHVAAAVDRLIQAQLDVRPPNGD